MARLLDAKCRQCRREGCKLFLKGEKCTTKKCPIERRPYVPGHTVKDVREQLNMVLNFVKNKKLKEFTAF